MEAGAGGAVVSVSSDWSLSCLCPRSRQEDAAQTLAGGPPLHNTAYQLPRHGYCCRHGDHALKFCCPQLEFESLRRVNLSNVPTPARLREPQAALGRRGGASDCVAGVWVEPPELGVGGIRRPPEQEDYAKAEADASKAIEADGHDVKALFRRSQALQKLGRLDQAVYDLRRCMSLEPKNKAFQEALHDLGSSMQEKMKLMSCTDSKVEQMFQILLDPKETDTDKKQKAAQNLIVLAREEAGAEKIFQSDGVRLLLLMLDTGREDAMLAALRTLAGLCSGHRSRTMAILAELGAPRISAMLGAEHEQVSLAACNLLQVMFDALKEGLQRDFRGKEEALVLDPSKELKLLIAHLLEMLTREGASAHGRNNSLNLLIKVVPRKSLRDPNNSLTLWVIDQGLKKILEVGGTVCEAPGSLPATENSRMSAAVLLSKLYGDLKCDAERETFHRLCEDYFRSWFEGHGLAGKLRAIQTVSCLLQGPSEAGNQVLELEGIMESVLALCASVREVDQLVAVEALIHAADKAKRASFITANGVTLLKNIYKCSGRDSIRIRALVGLCKLGSAGGTDFSMKQFAEGSTLKLAKQCRKWLCNEVVDAGTRRWAVEGLAYLTFDADVKEEFVEDKAAVQAMFQLAKSEDRSVLFAVASTLVNCTNSYDHEEPDPQMLELAKYAKQHVPEQHPKDEPGCVRWRVHKLLAAGVVSALTCMVKSENPALTNSCRELISRVFLAVVEEAADRGSVVAQGGGKTLIPLSLEGTEVGQAKAAQALAKITITSNPEMAFPGERIYEVVRPLVSLLHLHRTGLENFEGLMALTNLAGISERLRQKILKEKAVPMIEGYMFEEHELLRLAATECMCNMAMSTEVQELFLAEGSDRLKLLVLYSGEDDEKLRRAASGTLAMLTSLLPPICRKITLAGLLRLPAGWDTLLALRRGTECGILTDHWLEILQALLLSPNEELQHRGAVIVLNMMAGREIAAKLMESEMLEILSVLAKEERDKPRVAQAAKECLARAVACGLIKPNVNGEHGQLGHGGLEPVSEPRLVEALHGMPMGDVAAGGWHSVSVSEGGDLYAWGWNESGQLALPCKALAEKRPPAAASVSQHEEPGAGEAELKLVSPKAPPGAEAGDFISIQAFPALLDLPEGSEVSKVSCGSRHTAAVTRTGELYTWGWGKYGQLGHTDTASSDQPRQVGYFPANGLSVEDVVCGPWNTYICAVEK
ncbi:Protein unc-45 like protein A [Chelonia mydas]|uniref:Protein unc-45 like protein A n=1 Tax=Chelonia mydas TaxID=8469 RepID=M7BDM9_CHEMY|nr:Protein unc-45 like protein A [Chelonia mydas]